nr:lysophospholipid acyltransferase family protein [Mesorhizobium xinjiangense]
MKAFWLRIRRPLAQSRLVKGLLVRLLSGVLRFVYLTNRVVPGSHDPHAVAALEAPSIFAMWHGQHLLIPCIVPRYLKAVAMFSRSRDAELNAAVAERFGITPVRGSGGRESGRAAQKGGARALIALKKALGHGRSVAMIADIPHGKPREAGLGIVTLARISGRPIVPVACATSRRKVLEKSWDKTTINLPFGRRALVAGEPIYVNADADDAEMERKRVAVTQSLDAATAQAYRLVDGKP